MKDVGTQFSTIQELQELSSKLVIDFQTPLSAKQRSACRESFSIKSRVAVLRSGSVSRLQANLIRKEIWALRKAQSLDRIRKATVDKVTGGRSLSKTKKLHRIDGVRRPDDNSISYSTNEWGELISKSFASRWDSQNVHEAELLASQLQVTEGITFSFTHESMQLAFSNLRNKFKLDINGVCTRAYYLVYRASPDTFCVLIQKALASNKS